MAKPSCSRKVLERKIQNARLVQAWKKRGKETRCKVSLLASKLGLSRKETQGLIDLKPKRLDVPRQKIRVIREAASRISKPRRRRDTATKLHKECKVTTFSVETTRRLRKPYRDMELADRKAAKDFQKYRSVGPRVYTDGPVADLDWQSSSQGW
jgi:hypothetical protein